MDMDIFDIAKAKKLFGGGGGKREGTAIPRGEDVTRIYFNTHNTAEETTAILSKLTYLQTPLFEYPVNVIYATNYAETVCCIILAVKIGEDRYVLTEVNDIVSKNSFDFFNTAIYSENGGWGEAKVKGIYGNLLDLVFAYSMRVLPSGVPLTEFNGIPIGAENEKIKNVLSITPF